MKKNPRLFIILLVMQLSLLAQTRQASGKVTDDTGSPLPGVSVLVKGSKTGVQTKADGSFTIPGSGTIKTSLVFSYTGYKLLPLAQMAQALFQLNWKKKFPHWKMWWAVIEETTQNVKAAYELVLKKVGAILPKRDTVDERVISNTIKRTGRMMMYRAVFRMAQLMN
jgi:hypothetical protein